jgi:2-polyprenyl-3-methyl-5-hydroxy-6-metoxy-1,4-benzoquinol methylase
MPESKVYSAVNEAVLECVPKEAKRILDIGCGTGAFAERVKGVISAEIVGITYSRIEADLAATRMDLVHHGDLNSFDFRSLGKFDCVVMSHVLEHLYDPLDVLRRLKTALTEVLPKNWARH